MADTSRKVGHCAILPLPGWIGFANDMPMLPDPAVNYPRRSATVEWIVYGLTL